MRTDIGIMFQDSTLVPWRSVRGNVELQLALRGLSPAAYRERIDALLASVGLADFADRKPYELSGGMQQRAAFCQAMVHEPPTVLLDEPLGKLDAMTRERIRADLQDLWLRTRPTVLLVTHSIEEAVQLLDTGLPYHAAARPAARDHRHRSALAAQRRGEKIGALQWLCERDRRCVPRLRGNVSRVR